MSWECDKFTSCKVRELLVKASPTPGKVACLMKRALCGQNITAGFSVDIPKLTLLLAKCKRRARFESVLTLLAETTQPFLRPCYRSLPLNTLRSITNSCSLSFYKFLCLLRSIDRKLSYLFRFVVNRKCSFDSFCIAENQVG